MDTLTGQAHYIGSVEPGQEEKSTFDELPDQDSNLEKQDQNLL